MCIEVRHLCKYFETFTAVDDVSFTVPQGSLAALLGPSGGGKSTILRLIAGLETADKGEVFLDGEPVDALHPRERQVGFVFQHYALFRHMTVSENIGFGLMVKNAPKNEIRDQVEHMLKMVGLTGFGNRYPSQLSGGQRQRVALARALAPKPRLLLLDEPFGAVDAKVREELGEWLSKMHEEMNITSIFVTHDQHEAFSLCNLVMIINKGKLEQSGSPIEVLRRPSGGFVESFVDTEKLASWFDEKPFPMWVGERPIN
jgi:sulfate transport system ATP-binding protein